MLQVYEVKEHYLTYLNGCNRAAFYNWYTGHCKRFATTPHSTNPNASHLSWKRIKTTAKFHLKIQSTMYIKWWFRAPCETHGKEWNPNKRQDTENRETLNKRKSVIYSDKLRSSIRIIPAS